MSINLIVREKIDDNDSIYNLFRVNLNGEGEYVENHVSMTQSSDKMSYMIEQNVVACVRFISLENITDQSVADSFLKSFRKKRMIFLRKYSLAQLYNTWALYAPWAPKRGDSKNWGDIEHKQGR
jgi:hypothetical protein